MAVTNAISGMTCVGGMILLNKVTEPVAKVLAVIGVVVSMVNVIGGFAVSQRLLNLFRRPGEADYSAMLFLPGAVIIACAVLRQDLQRGVNSIASVMCIAAIGCLASMKTSNSGCKLAMIGVLCGFITAILDLNPATLSLVEILLPVGGVVGLFVGMKVSSMALPQTVA